MVEAVLRDNAPEVAKFRAGKDRVKGYLVGQAMKRTGGRANPALIERLMLPLLKGPD